MRAGRGSSSLQSANPCPEDCPRRPSIFKGLRSTLMTDSPTNTYLCYNERPDIMHPGLVVRNSQM